MRGRINAPNADDPLWYKDALIYQLHVRAFFDSNDDGIGDFAGLRQKLDYLAALGVDCLWLLPFHPSPLRDDGYDIADYHGIHASYGTLRDFKQFLREAHERGIRVISELVINHTSDQHPWFQAARRSPPGSTKRTYYVWSDTKQKYADARIIFTDTETSNWTWDPLANAYYWHRFFHHQPDLNFDNPHVLRALVKVMRFWFDMGVDGMRLDAVPYLIERDGTTCENLPETHDILRQIRQALDARYTARMLLAEANQWPADVRPYFGDGDECHMAYHFPLMPRMFMALRQEDRHPITEILRQTPDIPDTCQWALFLRNHDEMTLEMVTDEERDYLYQQYAADPQMRINFGIRRRLAPLMENSRRRIELMNSLLFSMPGTPIIYYGDEIGMGDNIYLGDRHGVRTPMQWTGDRNAGFSRADPARLYAPPIMDAVYGYQAINVEAQERSPFSLLNWMKRMIALRKQHRTFSRGAIEFLHPENRKILAYVRRAGEDAILVVANLSRTVQPVELDLKAQAGLTPVEMLGRTEFPRVAEHPYFLTLGPYAFYWFALERAPASVTGRMAPETAEEDETDRLPALLVGPAWETILDGNVRSLIERDYLVGFLRRQRWFGGKARTIARVSMIDWAPFRRRAEPAFFTLVHVEYSEGDPEQYMLTLAIKGGEDAERLAKSTPRAVVARITGARKGVIIEASCDAAAAALWLGAIEQGAVFPTRHGGRIRAFRTGALAALATAESATPRQTAREQSNTSVVYGNRLILKLFRRLEPGPNPDLEVTRHLQERIGFTRVPPLAGGMEYDAPTSAPHTPATTLAMLQGLVDSQATGWDHAVGELGRYFDRAVGRAEEPDALIVDSVAAPDETPVPGPVGETVGPYLETAATLGRRTAELHLALAQDAGDPAFTPEPFTGADRRALEADMRAHAASVLTALDANLARLPEATARAAADLLKEREALVGRFSALTTVEADLVKIRVHGDYHLGQVLWTEGDFIILDFEGEPARPLRARRAKHAPLKDVAGMLRSFSYAAYVALTAYCVDRPAEFARLERWARLWQVWTACRFLRSYRGVAGAAGFIPTGTATFDALLQAFVLDKALYELRYELNNRPDWVRVPLWGVAESFKLKVHSIK